MSRHRMAGRNSVHDVVVAYCLAMAEVRVRFPLDAYVTNQ